MLFQDRQMFFLSFLFSEYLRKEFRKEVRPTTSQIHDKIFDLGFNVGMRMLETVSIKEKRVIEILHLIGVIGFLAKDMWRVLFGYSVEVGRVRGKPNECLLNLN